MKRILLASNDADKLTNKRSVMISKDEDPELYRLLKTLKDAGIDTTKHRYKMYYSVFRRYEGEYRKSRIFSAAGDWCAYLVAQFPDLTMSYLTADLNDYWGWTKFTPDEVFSEYPRTVSKMHDWALNWDTGSDDYEIRSLVNLDTGEYLIEDTETEVDEEIDEVW